MRYYDVYLNNELFKVEAGSYAQASRKARDEWFFRHASRSNVTEPLTAVVVLTYRPAV